MDGSSSSNVAGIKSCLVTKNSVTDQIPVCRNGEQGDNPAVQSATAAPAILRSEKGTHMQSILKHSRARSLDSALTSSVIGLECMNVPAFIYTTTTSACQVDSDEDVNQGQSPSATLVVDGSRFVVNPEIFMPYPDTMLGRMFSPAWSSNLRQKNDESNVEIQISGNISANVFRIILEFYSSDKGQVRCPSDMSASDLREAFDYFLIPFNAETVKLQDLGGLLHELSNIGARRRFEACLESELVPLLAHCARNGDRECHIVILCDGDEVDWDPDYPPQMGDQYSGVLRNSDIHRFFKYVENRDVAKDVLRDRGFKKIKLGIEGYPTHIEKIKRRGLGRAEVIYNYIQRSFMRMSWEKEEAKSRHVDFQCVRIKAGNNLTESATDAMANVRLDPPPQVLVDHHQQRIASLGSMNEAIDSTLQSAVEAVMSQQND